MHFNNQTIRKAIQRSQHCQRNWDLSKEIPEADLEVFMSAVTECPSKQNVAFYKTHFVMNREKIELIHEQTNGFTINYETKESTTNSQVLANLLVVFEPLNLGPSKKYINEEIRNLSEPNPDTEAIKILKRDRDLAIGIAAGYLNLSASLMGYSTGCCSCFDSDAVQKILELENAPELLMGVGFNNSELGRRIHHVDHNFLFPTKIKQEIAVNIIR